MDWYKTGTISVTNGSAIVSGAGTSWLDIGVLNPGDIIVAPNSSMLEIQSFQANGQLTLVDAYLGATAAGQAYKIIPIGLLPSALAQQLKATLTAANAVIASAVRSDTAAQGLTAEQKSNARINIDALTAAEVGKGYLSKSVAGGVDVTLSATEDIAEQLELLGALTANINVIVSATARQRSVKNSTTGAFAVTVKTPAGTGLVVAQGKGWTPLACDGTNVVNSATNIAGPHTVSGALTVTGNIEAQSFVSLPSGQKLYLDNGGDSYILESSPNTVDHYAGGVKALSLSSGGAVVTGAFEITASVAASYQNLIHRNTAASGYARIAWGNDLGTVRASATLRGSAVAGGERFVLGAEGNFPVDVQINGSPAMTISSSDSTGLAANAMVGISSVGAQGIDKGGSLGLGGLADVNIEFAKISGRKENATANNRDGYYSIATFKNGIGLREHWRVTADGCLSGGSGAAFPNSLSQSLDMPGGLGLFGYNNGAHWSVNAYHDDGGWKYKSTNLATRVVLGTDGSLGFEQAASGIAGAAVTWIPRFGVDASGHWVPGADNVSNVGSAALGLKEIFCDNNVINTSDARWKTSVRPMTVAELEASRRLAPEIGVFQFLAAVAEKGDAARLHIGMTVQRAIAVMTDCGLDPFAYGIICHDAWPDLYEQVQTNEGAKIALSRKVERQAVSSRAEIRMSIELRDGVPVQVRAPVTVLDKLFDHLPVVDEAGKVVMVVDQPAKIAVVDEAGVVIEAARAETYKPLLYPVPVMEWVDEPYEVDAEPVFESRLVRAAGDKYSFRVHELLLLIVRGQAARLAALEGAPI